MSQIGSNEKPVMFRKAIVSKESRYRKGFNKQKFDENYDKIFNSKAEKDSEAKEEIVGYRISI